jgi:poly-gamma-glutamate synthesis protein (capsule biosynthesis protein)
MYGVSQHEPDRSRGIRRRRRALVLRRRRLLALLGLAALILLVVAVTHGDDSELPAAPRLTAAQELRLARTEHPVHFTVSVSGDLLIHSQLWAQALTDGGGSYDFAPMLDAVRPYTAGADLAICHMETPMTPGASSAPASYPVFDTPPELAKGIRATGWDACDSASNHSLDQGQDGIDGTGAALDGQGIAHTGSFASPALRGRPLILRVDGVKLGYLAYTDLTNGIPLPHPWSLNTALADDPLAGKAQRILADARAARKAGAEAVLLNMHWGDENSAEPNDSQLELARRLTRSPLITAIVGQGPHVVQPIERINGKFVVFSEGNLLSAQGAWAGLPAETQYGLIALLHCTADGHGVHVDRVTYVPTWVDLNGYRVIPVGVGLRKGLGDPAAERTAYDSVVGVAGHPQGVQPVPPHLPG